MSSYLKIENKDLKLSFDFYDEINSGKYVSIDKFMSIAKFNQLRDIKFSGLDENHFLVYNKTVSEWQNKSPENAFSAMFSGTDDPSLNDLSLLSKVYNGEASSSTTEFLRHDGTWAEPSSSSIVGIVGDETTKELTIDEDFSLVFTTNSSTFSTKLTTETSTVERKFTFPDEISGEVSLSPMYNTYYKNTLGDGANPVTFTKNNECVWLYGTTQQSNHDAENNDLNIFLEIPDVTNLTNYKSLGLTTLGDFSTRRGARFKICRHKSANIFIAPSNIDHKVEILGSNLIESSQSRLKSPQSLEVGKFYRIAKLTNGFDATLYGASNSDIGTFFKCTAVPNNNFHTVSGPKLFECFHVTPQDLKFGFIDIVGYQTGNDSADFCYTISTPSQVFSSPTFSGDISFTGTPVFNDNATFNSSIIAQDGINLREPTTDGTNYVKLTAPAIGSSDSYTLTLPNTSSTADNQIMKADQSGNFQWVTIQNDTSLGADSDTSSVDVPTQASIKAYVSDYVESSFREYLDENVNNTVYQITDYTQGSTKPEVYLASDIFGKETAVTLDLNSNPDYWMPVIYFPPIAAGLTSSRINQQFDIIVDNQSSHNSFMAHTNQRLAEQQWISFAAHPSDPKIFRFANTTYRNPPSTARNFLTNQILDSTEANGGTNNKYFNFSSLTTPSHIYGPGSSTYYVNNLSRQNQGNSYTQKNLKISDLQTDGWLPQDLSDATLTGTPLWNPSYAIKIANSTNVKTSTKSGSIPDGDTKWNVYNGLINTGNFKTFMTEAKTAARFRCSVRAIKLNRAISPIRANPNGFENLTPSNTNNTGTHSTYGSDTLYSGASSINSNYAYQWVVSRVG